MSEEETFKVTDRRGRGEPSPDPSPRAGVPRGDHLSVGAADLAGLFMMFASSALISLGVAPDPESKETRADLEQARAAIDMLLMLRDKTNGNRTEQESRVLESILYDLQMRFVQAAHGRPGS